MQKSNQSQEHEGGIGASEVGGLTDIGQTPLKLHHAEIANQDQHQSDNNQGHHEHIRDINETGARSKTGKTWRQKWRNKMQLPSLRSQTNKVPRHKLVPLTQNPIPRELRITLRYLIHKLYRAPKKSLCVVW